MADSVTLIVSLVVLFFVLRFIFGGGQPNAGAAARTQRGRAPPRRYPVSPAQVDTVLNMFPNFPRHIIEADLGMTGSVEATCENILSGSLVPPPPDPTPSPASAKIGVVANPLRNFIKDDSVPMPTVQEKVWQPTKEEREANLRARKEMMVMKAREKLKKGREETGTVDVSLKSD
ncbi:hypothetical protein BC829DRAFT_430708 [Chytridium lagenaria]|nr:hypothetical protein BC829DRAFT_430708 [Chytridium lagenaria]